MKITRAQIGVLLVAMLATQTRGADWQLALPGWRYEFPRDHGVHPEFRTEWWYFTGNLRDADGRESGYELTFFREGIRPLAERGSETSRFIVNDLKFAHFAVSDLSGGQFRFYEKISRGAFGEAGFDDAQRLAWIENWSVGRLEDGSFELAASENGHSIKLRLEPTKPPVIHGEGGVSRKAAGEGQASHYYSFTRLRTSGALDGREVTGESWFDHEWATNQLGAEQVGWNWFSLQFEDGTEFMLYEMRLKDGGVDPVSSGTFVAKSGEGTHLGRDDYKLTALGFWKSKATGANYPVSWRLEIPRLKLDVKITTPLMNQELVVKPVAYWEGAIRAEGSVRGRGYMELTGYSGPVGLSR